MTDTTTQPTTAAADSDSTVDRFCQAVASARIGQSDVFSDDAVFEATVPNWRFVTRGADAVRRELGDWFATPGRFEWLRRTPLPDGELVEFELSWEEHGDPYRCRQVHVLRLRDGLITEDAAWCGGRWPVPLLDEMAAAQRAADAAAPAG